MLEIYQACCENERELRKEAKQIKRLYNNALRFNRAQTIQPLTKTYALLYSAYVEVSFLKTIHTPYGFDESFITQIQSARNLEEKWEKCLELAFRNIATRNKLGVISNQKQELIRYLKRYIIEPSHIRNKIAHGQWIECLNSDCTAVNHDLSTQMSQLDFVTIDRYFNIYQRFSQCVEDLIESPNRAHFAFFYGRLDELKNYIDKTETYSSESKAVMLQSSPKQKSRPTKSSPSVY